MSYEEDCGCYHNTYGGGNHCETKYGGYYNDYGGVTTNGHETNYPPDEDEMCGIAEHTLNMATVLKEKLKEKEKQMKLAQVTKRLEGATEKVIKAAEHLAQKKEISPQVTKAIEQHLAAVEREKMAGIIERPEKL